MHNDLVISLKAPAPAPVPPPAPKPELAPPPSPKSEKKHRSFSRAMLPVVGVIVLGTLAGGGLFAFMHTAKAPLAPVGEQASVAPAAAGLVQKPPAISTDDTQSLIAHIGTLILLPDEQPTVARVTDLSNLHSEAFFQHAAIGDVVLMFIEAKKAVLYDPRQDKIIEVGPIATAASSTQP